MSGRSGLAIGAFGIAACGVVKRRPPDDSALVRRLVRLDGQCDSHVAQPDVNHQHFMPLALLDSQFATLQEPTPDEHPIAVNVGDRPVEIAIEIVRQLEERQGDSWCDAPTSLAPNRENALATNARNCRRWTCSPRIAAWGTRKIQLEVGWQSEISVHSGGQVAS
jgi:hypothetical protein